MSETSQNLEKLIASLGGRGRFQTTIHLLAAFTYVPLAFHHVIMAFHGSPIPHQCMAGADVQIGPNSSSLNISTASLTVINQPYVTNITHSQCHSTLFYSDGQQEVIQCSAGQWEYFPKYGEKNLVIQFDLVCSHEYMVSLATTIYFVGVMMGGLVFGDLADRFGRLPIMLITLYGCNIVAFVDAFAVNYTMFVSLRFILGFLIQGLQNSAYTLIMELFKPKFRPFAGIMAEIFFAIGQMALAGLAFWLREWQHLQIAISVIPLVTIVYPWIVPESIRWLVTKGKTEKAEKQLHRICKINKIPYPEETWNLLKQTSSDSSQQMLGQQQYNVTHLFRTWWLMTVTLISSFQWFVAASSYYGLTFKLTSFSGNHYLNFFISGFLEVVTLILCILCLNKFGRKKPLLFFYICAATMCLTAGFLDTFATGLGYVVTALGIIGRCTVANLFSTMFLYTSEIYPTVVRTIGLGFGMVWARLGAVVAPQLNQWAIVLLGFDAIYIFGTLLLISAVLVVFLPETHKKRLPDTITEDGAWKEQKGKEEEGNERESLKFDGDDEGLTELREIKDD